MPPRTKVDRKAVLKHLRRAPTPSGVYAKTCPYCGSLFGATNEQQVYCSSVHRRADAMERHRERQRRYEVGREQYEAVAFDAPLNSMTYVPTRGFSDASDPRADTE